MPRKKNHKVIREPLWYKDAVIYELHIKAFKDENNDGIGDFAGLFSKLDYLENLGITAIWLLPFYPSPQRDDGYDISDYRTINPSYGDINDFKRFLKEAHNRNLKVIIELVMNHTSDQHEWFQRARRAPKGSLEREYYVWSDDPEKYKGVRVIFPDYEASNWTWDPVANQYYWHRFFHHQPDLNYYNPAVQKEMLKIMDYWLAMGVDGFRLDAIPYLFEEEGTTCDNLPQTHEFLRKMRKHLDSKHENVVLLAEANMWPEDSASYFGKGDECHMNFYFPIMPRMFMAVNMEDRFPITDIIEQIPPIPDNCQWATFLRNHDELTLEMVTEEERDYMYKVYTKDPMARINLGIRKRLAPLLENDRRKIELMNVLLFSLPGTPVIYYGDEIGMGDNHFLGDRNGVRTPMQWDADRNAGFSDANPHKLYLPVIIDPEYSYATINVENQLRNSNSLLWWTRRLIKMRKRFKVFGRGKITFFESDNTKVIVFVRTYKDEQILVVANLSRYALAANVEMPSLKGLTPVEVFSQNKFQKIGSKPYPFTLFPYGYFWFKLTDEKEKMPIIPTIDREMPEVTRWADLVSSTNEDIVKSQILIPYLSNQMWFNKRKRNIESLRIFDAIPILGKPHRFEGYTLLLHITYFEGLYEKYRFAIGFAKGREEKKLRSEFPDGILARITFNGKKGVLFDASYSVFYRENLFNLVRRNAVITTENSAVKFNISEKLKAIVEEDGLGVKNNLIESRRNHVVIQYGKKFILKLYRKIDRGSDRDVEIIKYLSEKKRFQHVPLYLGQIEHQKSNDIKRTLGMFQEYVPNYGSAWDYFSEALNRFYERVSVLGGALTLPPVEGSLSNPLKYEKYSLSIQQLIGGPSIEQVSLLARRTAEMHIALGLDCEHDDFEPEEFTLHYQRSLFSGYKSSIRIAFEGLKKNKTDFPRNHQDEISNLLSLKDTLLKKLARIYDHKIDAVRIRPHGKYTLNRLLLLDGDYIITNFEGDPSYSLTERRLRKSPLTDLASMIKSFHYVAYSALFANEPSGRLAEHWFHHFSQIFLENYREHVKGMPFIPNQTDFNMLIECYLTERYLNDLALALERSDLRQAIIQVRGVLKILNKSFIDIE